MAFELAGQNIVVAGEFNRAIIRPSWLVRENVLPDGETRVALTDRPGALSSFRFADFEWVVGPDRLVVKPLPPELPSPGPVVAKILELLRHTPVSALGHNYLFQAPLQETTNLIPRFGLLSGSDVAEKLGLDEPSACTWSLTANLREDCRLTVKMVVEPPSQKLDLNFHFAKNDTLEAASAARRFDETRDLARDIVDRIVGE